jgi:hypothetical protein
VTSSGSPDATADGASDGSSEPTPSATSSGDSKCFPGDATVELESGAVIPMHELAVGDSVKVGAGGYSRVFLFTHKLSDVPNTYVVLRTASGASLSLTKGHYIYANSVLVAASSVRVGDVLRLGDGSVSPVTMVGARAGAGLFNPQTLHGDVVVDGVVSSTYTSAVEPAFAHAILAPFRLLNSFGFTVTALESGGGALANFLPRGQPVF